MKALKWVIVLAILAYVAWIAMPVIKGYIMPVSDDFSVPSMSQDSIAPEAGMGEASIYNDAPVASESIQGQTALTAMLTGNIPVVVLWGGVVALYLVSAFLQANGNVKAFLAYGLGFIADLILTYITKGQAGSGMFDKIIDVLAGWDPRYVVTLAAIVLGILMIYSSIKPKSRRA